MSAQDDNAIVAACSHALHHNLALRPGESVLIITDAEKRRIGDAFREAAGRLGARVELLEIPVTVHNGQEPPAVAAAKMGRADVVLMPLAKSLSWTHARQAATAAGARIASMARITEETILRTFPIDYTVIRCRVNALADLLDRASAVRVQSAAGTDLRFEILGRSGRGRSGGLYTEKGKWGNLPCGEAFVAPVEGSATGVYVVDASHAGVGALTEPITITVAAGRAIAFAGGAGAATLEQALRAARTSDAFNIAEFGIGCNHRARICGLTLEDEKVLGTCHIALGSNIFFGGTVDAGIHVDGVLRAPTIWLDSRKIMSAGRLQI